MLQRVPPFEAGGGAMGFSLLGSTFFAIFVGKERVIYINKTQAKQIVSEYNSLFKGLR